MIRKILIAIILMQVATASATWTFQEVTFSPGGNIYDGAIDWRPQGDYALIAAGNGLYRYNYPAGTLEFLSLPGQSLYRLGWNHEGEYAVITGYSGIFQYNHSTEGFGPLTEITSIETGGAEEILFYKVLRNPVEPGPVYITSNVESTAGQHQLMVYRYDPMHSPQVYRDFSGGTTYAAQWEYGPFSASFQGDGDYFVIANKLDNNYTGGFFVFDPDQSTFPKETSGAMQFYAWISYIGNCNAVAMSKAPEARFVLVKGNGKVQRAIEQGLPATFIRDTQVPYGPDTEIFSGDADYSWDGSRGIVVDSEDSSPHRLITFDSAGAFDGAYDYTVNRDVTVTAVKWHPAAPMALIGGTDRWIVRVDTDEAPPLMTPTRTQSPTATPTTAFSGTPPPTHTASPPPTPTTTAIRSPIATPTPTPNASFTPPPTQSAIPTHTPAATVITLLLELNANLFHSSDPFLLTRRAINPGNEITLQEWIILDVYGKFWFWPNWTESASYTLLTMPDHSDHTINILDFIWPEGNYGTASGLRFWGAFVDPEILAIVGKYSVVEFGYE